mmetsp:Transcript_4739/g.12985  ORF Transcript_4739/g.12985 Transcript_4739/m.12985 type:complete len:257 (-) Transcript_4739:960-1730(-)
MRRFFWDLSDLSAERRPGRFGSLLLAACAWAWAFSLAFWAASSLEARYWMYCPSMFCRDGYTLQGMSGLSWPWGHSWSCSACRSLRMRGKLGRSSCMSLQHLSARNRYLDGQSEGNAGLAFLVTTARTTALSLSCLNTFSPVKTSHMTIPKAYTSEEGNSWPLARSSLGMWVTVPKVRVVIIALSWLMTLLSPKSLNFPIQPRRSWSEEASSTLAAFRSPWMIWCSWRNMSACTISFSTSSDAQASQPTFRSFSGL